MSLRSDKDVETYLLKSRSDDNEKMSCYWQFIRVFNFYKENYIHSLFLNFYKEKYEINSLHSCYELKFKEIFVVRLSKNQYKSTVQSQFL